MASQPLQQPPLAALPQIAWGNHVPNSSASPNIRLHCALLDFVQSGTIESAVHAPFPFFTTTPNLVFRARYDGANGLAMLLSAYGLDSLLNASTISMVAFRILTSRKEIDTSAGPQREYEICATASVYNTSEESESCEFNAGIRMTWLSLDGARDISHSLSWDTVVAIIAHASRTSCRIDGEDCTPQELADNISRDPNPLRHLGYEGWVGLRFPSNGQYVPSFRRMN